MANKQSNKNQSRRRKNQSQKNRMRGGSDFNVPIRAFYPQNTFAQDPSRQMSNSVMKGGKKNHSRKYLYRRRFNTAPFNGVKKRIAGGSGFLHNFGSLSGSHIAANQITGIQQSNDNFVQSYNV